MTTALEYLKVIGQMAGWLTVLALIASPWVWPVVEWVCIVIGTAFALSMYSVVAWCLWLLLKHIFAEET